MPCINTEIDCCGINEISDISDNKNCPEQTVLYACSQMYLDDELKQAFLIFSDIREKIAGKNLAKFILKNKLGTITKSPAKINPNSKNNLTMWIWSINQSNLKRYWNKNKKNYKEYDPYYD